MAACSSRSNRRSADRIYNRTVRVELPSVVFSRMLGGSMDYLQRADKYSRKHKGHWCSNPAVVTAVTQAHQVTGGGYWTYRGG